MKNSYVCYLIISGLFLLLMLSGCGSTQPSRFYTLYPLGDLKAEQKSTSADHNIYVAIGPVEIPDYLDRPNIVIRTSQNELTLSEFDRWAGSLKEDIARVLSENISKLTAPDQLSVVEWGWGADHDYRVAVDIKQFDIMPEGNVLLKAEWALIGKNGTRNIIRQERVTEPIHGHTYEEKVSSMSRALETLSRNIASEVKSAIQKQLSAKPTQ
jgi:uncharacterized lipoprotein YmbA